MQKHKESVFCFAPPFLLHPQQQYVIQAIIPEIGSSSATQKPKTVNAVKAVFCFKKRFHESLHASMNGARSVKSRASKSDGGNISCPFITGFNIKLVNSSTPYKSSSSEK